MELTGGLKGEKSTAKRRFTKQEGFSVKLSQTFSAKLSPKKKSKRIEERKALT